MKRYVIVSTLFASACAPTQEVVPPVFSLGATSCSSEPSLSSTLPITFNPKEPVTIEFRIDQSSRCLQTPDDRKQLYQMVQLPSVGHEYIVTVRSKTNGQSIFAPTLVTLKENGDIGQQLSQSDFLFRGDSLTAKIEIEATEQYLMIASNPQSIGQSTTQIRSLINSNMAYSNGIAMRYNTGTENRSDYKFSHAGMLSVTTQAPPNRTIDAK